MSIRSDALVIDDLLCDIRILISVLQSGNHPFESLKSCMGRLIDLLMILLVKIIKCIDDQPAW
jgi:hypothetical protein